MLHVNTQEMRTLCIACLFLNACIDIDWVLLNSWWLKSCTCARTLLKDLSSHVACISRVTVWSGIFLVYIPSDYPSVTSLAWSTPACRSNRCTYSAFFPLLLVIWGNKPILFRIISHLSLLGYACLSSFHLSRPLFLLTSSKAWVPHSFLRH